MRDVLRGNPLLVLVILFSLLLVSGYFGYRSLIEDRRQIVKTASLRLKDHVWLLQEQTERLFDAIDSTFLQLGLELEQGRLESMSDEQVRLAASRALVYLPALTNFMVLDATGDIRFALRQDSQFSNRQAMDHYARHCARADRVSFSTLPPEGYAPGLLIFSRRLGGVGEACKGMLVATVTPSSYYEQRPRSREGVDSVMLLTGDGEPLAAWPATLLQHGGGNFIPAMEKAVVPGRKASVTEGDNYTLVYAAVRYPLKFVLSVSMEGVLSDWQARRDWQTVLFVIFGVLGGWGTFAAYTQNRMLINAREAVIRREKDYRTLAENYPSGIIMLFDRSGRILIAAGQALESAGWSRGELEGRMLENALPPDVASLMAAHQGVVLSGMRTTFTVTVRGRVYQAHALPLLDDRGHVASGMAVFSDITMREEYESALRSAKEAAENANVLKGQFVANISHELRTPISGIMGITEVALNENPPQKWQRYFAIIKNVSDGLLAVINDVLDFSRIEAGKLTLVSRPYDLEEVLMDIWVSMRIKAEGKGVQLSFEMEQSVVRRVEGDAGRLRQVLVNLLDNAIKFTESGGRVILSVFMAGGTGDVQQVAFSVSDTGIGIPADRLGDLFDSFSQVDGTLSRQHGGSGLGLAICKHLVEIMGGQLHVASILGKGSRFHFSLAMRALKPESEIRGEAGGEEDCANLPPLHILLAEDNELNREFLAYFLEDYGHVVLTAANGEEALECIFAGLVDIVLMDVQMPVVSGLEATQRVRVSDSFCRNIPIVALTAHAMAGDRERFLKGGMDDFVGKPVNKKELFAALTAAWNMASKRGWQGRRQRAA
jgi:PAS domain S-box-containing protein